MASAADEFARRSLDGAADDVRAFARSGGLVGEVAQIAEELERLGGV
jgi:hypothetical protein